MKESKYFSRERKKKKKKKRDFAMYFSLHPLRASIESIRMNNAGSTTHGSEIKETMKDEERRKKKNS